MTELKISRMSRSSGVPIFITSFIASIYHFKQIITLIIQTSIIKQAIKSVITSEGH